MKRVFLFTLLTLCIQQGYSQQSRINPTYIQYLQQKINTYISCVSEEDLAFLAEYSSFNPTIAEFWETNKFNPYPKQQFTKPFSIKFKDSTYFSPVPFHKVITSRYGWRHSRPHKGIDIDLVTGDSVHSVLDGKVRYVKYHSGHGKTVIVRNSNGLEFVYAHLSKQLVKENQLIKKGEVIGIGGATGNARGSHLHLEAMYKGVQINPEYLFDFSDNNKIRKEEIWVTNEWITPHLHSSKRQSTVKIPDSFEEAKAKKIIKYRTHKIRRGDTLGAIARKYGVSISALCKANGIKRTTTLRIGRVLIVSM
ncbi:M23 family metallopeptidase [Flavobacteriaceae bacterium F08102]|nr:M23 family metallopeptidase [Flavobacteriaceae bacterium F08102]